MATPAFSDRILAPVIDTAQRLDWSERRGFLDDLRRDAPAMIAEVERRLAARDRTVTSRSSASSPGLFARVRQFVHLRVHTTP
jgi:hypothetical protein